MKISFVGLGIMGSRMAANLLENGVEIKIWNRSSKPIDELVAKGATKAKSFEDVFVDADVVFTMLTTPQVVEHIMLSEKGGLRYMKPGSLWVDCSTVDPAFSKNCATKSNELSIRFMDIPVSGSKPQAQNAELIMLAGGEKSDFETVKPYLLYMGKNAVYAGEVGMGSALKMLVNSMLGMSILVFVETLLLGEKVGFDRNFLLDFLPNLIVSAPITKPKAEMIRKDEFELQFPLELMQKDLFLVSKMAWENQQPLFMSNLAKEIFADALKSGYGREDISAIYRFLKQKNG